MLDQVRIARIDKTPRQSIDQSDRLIALAQQQCAGIRADRATIKRRYHPATFYT